MSVWGLVKNSLHFFFIAYNYDKKIKYKILGNILNIEFIESFPIKSFQRFENKNLV